jgi:urease accessory protein
MYRLFIFVLAAAIALFQHAPAEAHLYGAYGAGFEGGFVHPFSGLDHMLAMVAVGLWAAQRGGKALWVVPGAFIGVMVLGGLAGFLGLPLPFVETGIAASLMVLGLLVAFALPLPVAAMAAVVGLFAFFHGHAHGTELPEAASPLAYAGGFVLATAILHAFGVGAGLLLKRPAEGRIAVRLSGAAIALVGLFFVVSG